MKALSVKQPWAWLICAGYKDIENRNWRIGRNPQHGPYKSQAADFSLSLPMRVCIHAGKSQDDMTKETVAFVLRRLSGRDAARFMIMYNQLAYGAVIGEVDITACVEQSTSPWFTGKYGFVLANPVLYERPMPCLGKLGFFEPEFKNA
jgi:hypothetical protein